MAWGEQPGLVVRFEAVSECLEEACPHWQLGTSYEGWVAAQRRVERAVDDCVVGHGEVRHVENVAERPIDPVGRLALDVDAVGKGEVQRDRLVVRADLDGDIVGAKNQPDLLLEQVEQNDSLFGREFLLFE